MRNLILLATAMFLFTSCNENDTTEKQEDGTEKTTDTTAKAIEKEPLAVALNISPLEEEGDMGRVTFSQDEKTLFYYDLTAKEGKIKLNGTEYSLNKYTGTSGNYNLSGKDVSITAPNVKYKKSEGEDCSYGAFAEVTVTLGKDVLKLKNVKVQDCPEYQ